MNLNPSTATANEVFEFRGIRVRAQPVLFKGYTPGACHGCMAQRITTLCGYLPSCIGEHGENLIFVEAKPALA